MALLHGPTTYECEPQRHPSLQINSKEPFNAETQPGDLVESYITPVDMFYKRNHGPIPILDDIASYRVEITGLVPKPTSLTLQDIKALKKYTVVATLLCAGNRRTAMSLTRNVKGVGWGLGALGNGEWAGARLADVLELAGVPHCTMTTATGGKHVEFNSVDACEEEEGGAYKASIPMMTATNPDSDVLLAYEMNGQELNRDHGYPLRGVVPGLIGARSVKWITKIDISPHECEGFYYQLDYKMFPQWVDWDNIVWSTRRPIMDFPVQCAICSPLEGSRIQSGSTVKISGYALTGGGRGIERVDVSIDGGKTWTEATRLQGSGAYVADVDELRQKWGWVLWELHTTLSLPADIVAKAVDSSGNVQPQAVEDIWNLRGVLNNSWHRVHVDPILDVPLITSSIPKRPDNLDYGELGRNCEGTYNLRIDATLKYMRGSR